ncbi:MAG: sodium:proton antiporter [Proteobacteria bacterium]|nr:sodium:proton antiporter [Pseudomonadota bacterium]
MTIFDVLAMLLFFCALFGFLNEVFLKLPQAIGLVLIALVASLSIITIQLVFPAFDVANQAKSALRALPFKEFLLDGILSALLFAGALQVNLSQAAQKRYVIITMATLGTLTSALFIALTIWMLAPYLGVQLPFLWAALFGAIISPTDPIAVIAIINSSNVPEVLRVEMTGESLLNDGVGVVLFTLLLGLVASGAEPQTISHMFVQAGALFLREAVGGALLGLTTGAIAFWMLKKLDAYVIEAIVTLSLVTGTYSIAHHLGVSGPIAVVIAGLLIGNQGATLAMSDRTRERLFPFWELVDEILNSVLFLLIGLEILVINDFLAHAWFAIAAIPIALLARLISVSLPIALFSRFGRASLKAIPILTWGGLRGGISVALALSLPDSQEKATLVTATYAVVVFSILVQGLSVERLVNRIVAAEEMNRNRSGPG